MGVEKIIKISISDLVELRNNFEDFKSLTWKAERDSRIMPSTFFRKKSEREIRILITNLLIFAVGFESVGGDKHHPFERNLLSHKHKLEKYQFQKFHSSKTGSFLSSHTRLTLSGAEGGWKGIVMGIEKLSGTS